MKLKVLNNYLLVEPISLERKTKLGIVLPGTSTQVPQKGKVLFMSDLVVGGKKRESGYRVGDTVIFKKWEAMEYKPEGVTGKLYLFIKHEHVLAKEI